MDEYFSSDMRFNGLVFNEVQKQRFVSQLLSFTKKICRLRLSVTFLLSVSRFFFVNLNYLLLGMGSRVA